MIQMHVIKDCTLYCGDCMEVLESMSTPVDAVITDPPYKMEIHGRGFAAKRDYYKKLDYGTDIGFELSAAYYEKLLKLLTEVNMLFFCNKLMKLDIENYAVQAGYTFDELVMCKKNPSPLTNNQWLSDKEFAVHIFRKCAVKGSYDTKCTWFIDNNYKDSAVNHPSPKPIYILDRIIKNMTLPDDTVLDTFMGSGSTGVSCVKNGRKFIGIEISQEYFDLSCSRIEEAYKQGDLFAPTEKLKQAEMGL